MRFASRAAWKRLAGLFGLLGLASVAGWWFLVRMPGESYSGDSGDPASAAADPDLRDELRRDVERLCRFGARNLFERERLAGAAHWIEGELTAAGYRVQRQTFEVHGAPCSNLEAELAGTDEIVVVGAHYDSYGDSPGANDNGSGVAATLALARRFARRDPRPKRTLRFLCFVNEEPPYFQTDDMGSLRYARRSEERKEKIVAMLSLETFGYFTDQPDSQIYPFAPLSLAYGDKGNFVGFVGNVSSGSLVRRALGKFREHAKIPSQGIALFAAVPGVGWSDHWSFWQCGYDAIMVTDTAPYRYPHYHKRSDTPDKLKYEEFALVVEALVPVIADLAG